MKKIPTIEEYVKDHIDHCFSEMELPEVIPACVHTFYEGFGGVGSPYFDLSLLYGSAEEENIRETFKKMLIDRMKEKQPK